MISILQREINAMDIEEQTKDNMLKVLMKSNSESVCKQDKISVLLKVGFKYIKISTKMFAGHKIDQAKAILQLLQRSMNQIYLSQESYMWSVLKIRIIITRLQYIQSISLNQYKKPDLKHPQSSDKQNQSTKHRKTSKTKEQNEKLGFKQRIHLFCEEIIKNPHCKQLQSDFYSQIEVIYFFGIESLLKKMQSKTRHLPPKIKCNLSKEAQQLKKDEYAALKDMGIEFCKNSAKKVKDNKMLNNLYYKTAKQLILRCRNSLRQQIEKLCEKLRFEQKKVYQIIQRKSQFLMKVYGIESLIMKTIEGQTSIRAQHRLWKNHYYNILFTIPNRIESKQMDTFIASLFNKKTPRHPNQNSCQDQTKQQCVSSSSIEECKKLIDVLGQEDSIKYSDPDYLKSKTELSNNSSLKINQKHQMGIIRNSQKVSKKKINFQPHQFVEESPSESSCQNQSSNSQSMTEKSSNHEKSLDTQKRLALQNLMDKSVVMKPRYGANNRFLSIQYRPSLLASAAQQQKKVGETGISTAKKVALIHEIQSSNDENSNKLVSGSTFISLKHKIAVNGKIGGGYAQSEIFKISLSKKHSSLPSKKNIESFQTPQNQITKRHKGLLLPSQQKKQRLVDLLGDNLSTKYPEKQKNYQSLPHLNQLTNKKMNAIKFNENNAEKQNQKTKRIKLGVKKEEKDMEDKLFLLKMKENKVKKSNTVYLPIILNNRKKLKL